MRISKHLSLGGVKGTRKGGAGRSREYVFVNSKRPKHQLKLTLSPSNEDLFRVTTKNKGNRSKSSGLVLSLFEELER